MSPKPNATDLGTFEGKAVLNAAVEMPNAAGGLRDPMQFEPKLIHHGDEGYIVLKYQAKKVRFDPIKDTAALTRVTVLDITEGTFVDEELVLEHLAAQRVRLAEARLAAEADEKGGVITFPTDEDLLAAHTAGDHAKALQPGCVECEREAEAVADEAAADAQLTGDAEFSPPGDVAPAVPGSPLDQVRNGADNVTPIGKKAPAKKTAAKKTPGAKKAAAKKAPGARAPKAGS